MTKPEIIPVPTYLLSDAQLKDIVEGLKEVDEDIAEDGRAADPRAAPCIAAIRAELAWRGNPFKLNDDGTISQ